MYRFAKTSILDLASRRLSMVPPLCADVRRKAKKPSPRTSAEFHLRQLAFGGMLRSLTQNTNVGAHFLMSQESSAVAVERLWLDPDEGL